MYNLCDIQTDMITYRYRRGASSQNGSSRGSAVTAADVVLRANMDLIKSPPRPPRIGSSGSVVEMNQSDSGAGNRPGSRAGSAASNHSGRVISLL